jgi:hypothetical protein
MHLFLEMGWQLESRAYRRVGQMKQVPEGTRCLWERDIPPNTCSHIAAAGGEHTTSWAWRYADD